jgi:hypothetical protein
MPASTIDLDFCKEYIQILHEDGDSHKAICASLQRDLGIQTSERTLQRRLLDWDLYAPYYRTLATPEVKAYIAFYFCEIGSSDNQILWNLKCTGHELPNKRTLQKIRREMGLRRRMLSSEVAAEKEKLRYAFNILSLEPPLYTNI